MNCPRCATPMQPVQVGNTEVDHCPQCEGSWYDLAELGRMFGVPDKQMRTTHLVDRVDQPVDLEKPVACPRCGAQMERNRYLKDCEVLVDRCDEHGVWLDGGELDALLKHMGQQVKTSSGIFAALGRLFGR